MDWAEDMVDVKKRRLPSKVQNFWRTCAFRTSGRTSLPKLMSQTKDNFLRFHVRLTNLSVYDVPLSFRHSLVQYWAGQMYSPSNRFEERAVCDQRRPFGCHWNLVRRFISLDWSRSTRSDLGWCSSRCSHTPDEWKWQSTRNACCASSWSRRYRASLNLREDPKSSSREFGHVWNQKLRRRREKVLGKPKRKQWQD